MYPLVTGKPIYNSFSNQKDRLEKNKEMLLICLETDLNSYVTYLSEEILTEAIQDLRS